MKKLQGLLDEDFIACYPSLAVRAGINQALILQKLHYLIQISEKAKNEPNHFAGRWWVYNTYADWKRDYFPWLSTSTIKRLFLELEHEGIIMSWLPIPGQETYFPGMPPADPKIDEGTKYYTIRYEAWDRWFGAAQKETTPIPKRDDPRPILVRPPDQNDPPPVSKKDGHSIYIDSQRIPETTTETTAVVEIARESVDQKTAAAAPVDKSAQDELIDLKTEAARLANEQLAQAALKEITRHFENNIQMVTSVTAEKLKDYAVTYPKAWVIDAIDEAVLHNARNCAYIEAILKRRQADGTPGKPRAKPREEMSYEELLIEDLGPLMAQRQIEYELSLEGNHVERKI